MQVKYLTGSGRISLADNRILIKGIIARATGTNPKAVIREGVDATGAIVIPIGIVTNGNFVLDSSAGIPVANGGYLEVSSGTIDIAIYYE
jgi:hypothetical protein